MKKAQELPEKTRWPAQRTSETHALFPHIWDDIRLTSREMCILRVILTRNHEDQIYQTNLGVLFGEGLTIAQPVSPVDLSHAEV